MNTTESGAKAGIMTGAIVGAMLTVASTAIFYLAWRLAGLPFVAFDVFDWTSRKLPGSIITVGIDTMVSVIRALDLGTTAEAAKTAEQTMAVAGMMATGVVAGAIVFALSRGRQKNRAVLIGLIAGLAVGLPSMLISVSAGQTSTRGPLLSGIWILGSFLVWGSALSWAFQKSSPDEASVVKLNRRKFLVKLGGATAFITIAGVVVGNLAGGRGGRREEELWSANNALPNAGDKPEPAPGTRPEFTPLNDHYRIDINTVPPTINETDWRLRVNGLVENSIAFTLNDIRKYPSLDQFVTLACISNPVGGDLTSTQRWTGVSLQRLLPDLRLRPEATHLKISAADGFFDTVALETIKADERVMLAYAWDGVPLQAQHGFPLRIYIPNLYGMKQPKWIESIEAMDHWEPGYWVERGWDREAQMRATSVIDTVAVDMMINQANEKTLIAVGGIAHAGSRGISKVEVKVDGGEWRQAAIRPPLSQTTWVIWRYDWPFRPGDHTFTVRCYDGSGALQIEEQSPPHPAGATGLNTRNIML